MGNPPFVGYNLQSEKQKADILAIYVDRDGKPYKRAGRIDFVAGWFFKAAAYIVHTNIRAAFVVTNSITQDEQVVGVWKPFYDRFGIHIDFAYRTFKWDSEASDMAAVHCVIVGFSQTGKPKEKIIYDGNLQSQATNINPYLVDASTIFIDVRESPISSVPSMNFGNMLRDGGHFILNENDCTQVLKTDPAIEK